MAPGAAAVHSKGSIARHSFILAFSKYFGVPFMHQPLSKTLTKTDTGPSQEESTEPGGGQTHKDK